jgi:nitrogen regulatory protein P-II 1
MPTMITAVIRPYALEDVKTALKAATVSGMTVTEVRGFGRQGGHTETYRGTEYQVDLLPKVKVEAVVPDAEVAAVIEAVSAAAGSGKIGDGKIWVSQLASISRIRTGELGDDAV